MKRLIILLLVLACAWKTFAQIDTAALKNTKSLIEKKKYTEALAVCDKLIAKDSSEAVYYDLRGMILFSTGKDVDAVTNFSKALSTEPNNALLYYHRSLSLYYSENPALAIQDCDEALKHLSAKDTLKDEILICRANAKSMQRDFPGSIEDYKLLMEMGKDTMEALTGIGLSLSMEAKYNEAIPYLEKDIKMYPDNFAGYNNLAYNYQLMGDYKRSLSVADTAIKLFPKEAVLYNNRGYDKYQLKDLKGALLDINASLKLYPQNSYAFRNRALVYLAMKDKIKACEDLRESLRQGFTLMYGNEVRELMKANCPAASIPEPDEELTR